MAGTQGIVTLATTDSGLGRKYPFLSGGKGGYRETAQK